MSSSAIITLNVGGQKVLTTRTTLMSDPNSTLARMFDPDSPVPPSEIVDGAYFIDADLKIFDVILHYLRYKSVAIPPNIPIQAVVDQAMFFGLDVMVEELSKPADMIKINVSGKIFHTSRETLTKKLGGKMSKLGRMVEKGEKEIFLDMNPEDCELILQVLRDLESYEDTADDTVEWSMDEYYRLKYKSSLAVFGLVTGSTATTYYGLAASASTIELRFED